MLVTTWSHDCSSANREFLEPKATDVEPPHSGLSTVEDSVLSSRNLAHGNSVIGNESISNTEDEARDSTVPSLMLLQQHIGDPEFRKLIGQLTDTQSSMMGILQSLIETHYLNSLQIYKEGKYNCDYSEDIITLISIDFFNLKW